MALQTNFGPRDSSKVLYCEDLVSSPVSAKDTSRKRKESDTNPAHKVRTMPRRSVDMRDVNADQQQRLREDKLSRKRQTRSQTLAHRLQTERVQQELDAYLDHIKTLAIVIEEQQRRQDRPTPKQCSFQGSASRSQLGRRRHRRTVSGSSAVPVEHESDADTEWERLDERKFRTQPRRRKHEVVVL